MKEVKYNYFKYTAELKGKKGDLSEVRTEGGTMDQVISKRDGTELPRKGQGRRGATAQVLDSGELGFNAHACDGPLKELAKNAIRKKKLRQK